MGLAKLLGLEKKPISEEERLRQEAERKAYQEAVRKLKDRALFIRSRIREVTDDRIFDELTQEQFVRYAKIVGENETILGVVPGHYTNAIFSFDAPVHVLFLDHRLLAVADAWGSELAFFSFSYKDIQALRKKGGIFESHISFACERGLADGKKPFSPAGGWDGFIFYRKSEYAEGTIGFEKALPHLQWA